MEKIKIALVDDHKIFLDGIVSLLEDCKNIEIKHTATSAADLLKKFEKDKEVDVLLSDISMDEMDGNELCKIFRKQYPHVGILILSMHKEIEVVNRILEAGALGYLLKNTNKAELVAAISSVASKKPYHSQFIKEAMIKDSTVQKKKDFFYEDQLTKREVEVLQLLAAEYTTQEIADKLFISPHTVESHRKNTLRKTHSRNIAGLIKYAIANKLLIDE